MAVFGGASMDQALSLVVPHCHEYGCWRVKQRPLRHNVSGWLMVSVTQHSVGAVMVKLEDELCLDTAPPVASALATAISCGAERVVVDLDHVSLLSAVGLRVLVEAAQDLSASGRSLALVNAHGIVKRVLEITALDELLDDCDGR